MKFLKMFIFILCAFCSSGVYAVENDYSGMFSEIYEKLDSVSFGGKNIGIAIEGLEKLNPKAHVAVTGERVVLVWGDTIVANYPKPMNNDWKSYGEITNSLILKMRENDETLANASDSEIYDKVVNSLLSAVNENGKYIPYKNDILKGTNRILTSIGVNGWRDTGGEFRVSSIIKGSPADVAGIEVFDLIADINGVAVADMSDEELDNALYSANSGTDKIKLLTPFGNKNVVLRRASIVLADADIIHRDSGNIDLLEIIVHNVSDNAFNIIREALLKYPDVKGIILDLRVANGNDVRSAAKLAGVFVGQKPIMHIAQDGDEDTEIVPAIDAITDAHVVVLTSDMTRGVAEAIAGAFYEYGRGVLVGLPTAGNAKMATHIDLSNGAKLELLNQSIKTGNGYDIDGRGVFPIVCLSNIRSEQQQNVFFLNVINNDFNWHDYNRDLSIDRTAIRKGCPSIVSGSDEDALSMAVAVKILVDSNIYDKLIM